MTGKRVASKADAKSRLTARRRRTTRVSSDLLEARTLLSTTWYVATTGSNSNPGSLAAPFKTIQAAADHAAPGDTVNIFGGVYHETVTVKTSGTAAAPIIFEPANPAQPVTIDGADPITKWTNTGGSIWTGSMPQNLGTGNNQIFVDGQMVNEARWPSNSLGLFNPTVVSVASVVNSPTTSTSPVNAVSFSTIHSPSITQPAGFWVGGEIAIGPGQNWVKQTDTITASGPGWVTFSCPTAGSYYQAPAAHNKFYLFGVAGALDSAGEWFRSSSGKLSLWTPTGDSPANHVVEAKARNYGFDLSAASNIQVDGINFFACTIKTSKISANIVINHITDQYLSHFSVFSNGWTPPVSGLVLAGTGDVLENSTLAWSAGDGVAVTGNNDMVSNNVIHDVDYAGVDSAPVQLFGTADTVTANTMYNAGRDGIFFSGGGQDTITHNLVYAYGLLETDLGGFYSFGKDGGGTVIAYNEFYDGVTGGYGAAGIFFDNNSSDFVVDHNIITDVNIGLHINLSGQNLLIYNNTFDAVGWSITVLHHDDWTGTVIADNIVTKPVMTFGLHATSFDNLSNGGQFVNAATGNFNLLPGAPAIHAALPIPTITKAHSDTSTDVGALAYGIPAFSVGALTAQVAALPLPPVATAAVK